MIHSSFVRFTIDVAVLGACIAFWIALLLFSAWLFGKAGVK